MSALLDNKVGIIAVFDSFSKTVLRNEVRNITRHAKNKLWKEGRISDPFAYPQVIYEDTRPFEEFTLTHDMYSCAVVNEWLFQALSALTENQRVVLMLNFWYDQKDKEIADNLGVTVRTVYNLRQRALAAIRQFYERTGKTHRTD